MNLTGQAKADFEKWFIDNQDEKGIAGLEDSPLQIFIWSSTSMKWGVIVDFAREVGGMNIYIVPKPKDEFSVYIDDAKMHGRHILCEYVIADTPEEARVDAVDEFSSLYNEMKGKQ